MLDRILALLIGSFMLLLLCAAGGLGGLILVAIIGAVLDVGEESLDALMTCGFVLGIVACAVTIVCMFIKNKEEQERQDQSYWDEFWSRNRMYQVWHDKVESTGEIEPIDVPMLLSYGEECLWKEDCVTLCEVRSVRHSSHSYGSVSLGRSGVRLGSGCGTSESSDEWRDITTGTLYITNKQIFFDGYTQNRKIPLCKLTKISSDTSSIEVGSESRVKSMIFNGVNGKICEAVVRYVMQNNEC